MDPKDLEALGRFSPFFQYLGGIIVLGGGILAIWKALRDMAGRPPAPVAVTAKSQADERDYADLERRLLRRDLEDVIRAAREAVMVEINRVERTVLEAAQKDRHELKNMMLGMTQQFEAENKELEKRIRYIEIRAGGSN